jgi:hypothetical protein
VVTGPTAAVSLDIRRSTGTSLLLEWTGGRPPFQLEASRDLRQNSWQSVGLPTNATSTVVPFNGPLQFYRVTGS